MSAEHLNARGIGELGGEVRDPHDVLGVAPEASLDEIRTAYRQLARQFHPDRFVDASPDDQRAANERMQEINHALAVLTSPTERQRFERQLRLREKREAANRQRSEQATEGATGGSAGASGRVRFTTGRTNSDTTSSESQPQNESRAWQSEPLPDDLVAREFSGWGDAHWVFVYGPGGRVGKMNVNTGEVTIEREERREDVLRVLQHYAFDSWT